MPITLDEVVAQFGRTLSNHLIGSPFRLPRFFPYGDCMIDVDMKYPDVREDQTSWNAIAKKATDVLHACVQGENYKSGGSEVAGSRSAIEVRVSWNLPEMNTLASLNRPAMEEAMARERHVGRPPLHPSPVLRMPF